MTELLKIIIAAFSSVPSNIIPFLALAIIISYLSYKLYIEFKVVYKKVNADKLELTNRIAKVEQELSLTDSKTIMLSTKLERIEESLNKMNDTLIELATTLKLLRETKTK